MHDDRHPPRTVGRRAVLAAAASGVTAAAGCLASPSGDDGSGADGPSGSAAFFTLKDWTNEIGGEHLSFGTPVETGEMGHGWDPDADIVPQIAQHDVFCYLRTPEFQWSIDVATELEADDRDIALIDGMEAIPSSELLPFVGTDDELLASPDTDVDFDPETTEIVEFEIVSGDEIAAYWHDGHWHGGVPDVPVGESLQLRFNVADDEGHVLPLGSDYPFEVVARFADGAPSDLLAVENRGDAVALEGQETGQTLLVFEVHAGDEVLFGTAEDPATTSVREPDDLETDAFHDPHVWTDPVHAQAMVTYLADELGDHFPDHASTFADNAAAYNERLEAVHRQFEALTDDAELEVAVLVAHDAFQYLEHRYGFELRTPVGVTPDAAESIEDVASLAQTVDEYGIDTILFDPFEAPNPGEDIPQAAALLLEETGATDAEPLSAAEGTTPAWRESGYGWVEQMEEVNLPSLRKALRAE